jgi:EmrB/QacA subfamily drug resistance transporter
VSPILLKLALTSYLLAIAIFLPVSGWLADRFGARTIFRLAIAVFTGGSVLCGLSQSLEMLVFARILQGIGGSMMVPVGRLIILRTVRKDELVGSLAWLTVPALVGPVLGPPLGGFLTTFASWPWIFWINIPVGILGFVLATLFIPDVRGERTQGFDTLGLVLIGFGLALFMSGSTVLGLGVLPAPIVVGLLAGGAACLVGFGYHARRLANPIVDLSLVRLPTFRHSLVGGLLFRIGMGATPFLLPLLLQIGFGMTAFESGLVTFASAVGAIAMKFAAPPILRRFGFRKVLVWNTFVAAFFVTLPALFVPATPTLAMTSLLLIGGFFRSLQFTAINSLTYADVSPERMSRATTLASVAQQLSLSVGISVGAIALELAVRAGGGELTYHAFWPAFAIIGIVTLLSLVPFTRLDEDAGDEMSGRRKGAPDPVTAMRERA